MNLFVPVSSLMTRNVISVNPNDPLSKVKHIFEEHSFHHLPVTENEKLVGMVSRTDFAYYFGSISKLSESRNANEAYLYNHTVNAIMVKGLGKLEPDDRLEIAIDVFSRNLFHALPVVENGKLVGILTTHDIIKTLNTDEHPERPEDAYVTGKK